jgi:hypothetical protein
MDKNSMLFWLPKIQNLGIPMPRTEILPLTPREIEIMHSGEGDCFNLDRLTDEAKKTISARFRLPVFLKTDHYSAKHFWKKSCFLDNLGNLRKNLMEIIVGGSCEDMPIEAIAVREFIPMETGFTAFSREMPVNPERRYFIRDGKVLCHHPYWIEGAVEKGTLKEKLPKDWKDIAKRMNRESDGEIKLLTGYSEKIAGTVEGFWSVDYCKARDSRWILIDMAVGEMSWHPEECPKYQRI